MAQGEAAVKDESYEWPMNPLAGSIVFARQVSRRVLRRKAHGFTNYADSEARGILIT